ncbi:hypothetical protein [Mycolicibacterium mageritense]|uniref:Uncharacterized protein n=1 Tax=Mycolicibacterium mageritense TaxID=53462 RepID=A0AAI8TYS3_MYCME|nr:hypothetical protein [Mycolicibacterium mageritense]TXI54492.1 MAG: hypothetical protein E6Q55_32750 [Mycolicibacterium mageritense]BDY30831.1 hypothetical protein hbim_04780 [Mycolicibacterium mageritense]
MSGKARHSYIAVLTAILFAVVGCGGSTSSGETSSAPPPAATPTAAPAPAGTKVSANNASQDEIAAALDAAGVKNAERWAHEVVEYRPYPTDDANLTKLRDNLAKYNPGAETVDKIVSALTP